MFNTFSVRQKVRNLDPDFSTASSYFINAFYPKGKGDPNDIEKGFLRSGLLVKVRVRLDMCLSC